MVSQPQAVQSHRVYWQQRLSGGSKSNTKSKSSNANSNNNLITGSAAVKITPSAKAIDLTNLLRKTLHLGNSQESKDALVLVGTLRSVPSDYVVFEHELEPHTSGSFRGGNIDSSGSNHGNGNNSNTKSSNSIITEDFHVVKTLQPNDACLAILEDMKEHLTERQRGIDTKIAKDREARGRRNVLSMRPTIAPQTRWYFVPDTSSINVSNSKTNSPRTLKKQQQPPTMTSCLELDGYLTSLDDDDSEDDDEEENDENNGENDSTNGSASGALTKTNLYGDDEDLLRRALAPFADDDEEEENKTPMDKDNDTIIGDSKDSEECIQQPQQPKNEEGYFPPQHRKRTSQSAEHIALQWRRYLQISQSHVAPDKPSNSNSNSNSLASCNNSTLAGFLLKGSSKDPHVWRRHYCVLTQDHFWYIPRVVRKDEFLSSTNSDFNNEPSETSQGQLRTIEIAHNHGRINLSEATLLGPSQDTQSRSDGFELVGGDGRSHRFRACSSPVMGAAVSSGAATKASIAAAHQWKRMLKARVQDSMENALIQHAQLLVTEETVARNDRWKSLLLDGGDEGETDKIIHSLGHAIGWSFESDEYSALKSKVLYFGLDVAEYKEGCRQIQTLLWAEHTAGNHNNASPSRARTSIPKLVKELWREATQLLNRAVQLNDAFSGITRSGSDNSINGSDDGDTKTMTNHRRRGLETLCHHAEYVITQKRRHPSSSRLTSSPEAKGSNGDDSSPFKTTPTLENGGGRNEQTQPRRTPLGENNINDYPHQRDPPPIDLFDLLWKELRTLG